MGAAAPLVTALTAYTLAAKGLVIPVKAVAVVMGVGTYGVFNKAVQREGWGCAHKTSCGGCRAMPAMTRSARRLSPQGRIR